MALYVTYHPEEATKKQKKEMKKNKNKTDWLIEAYHDKLYFFFLQIEAVKSVDLPKLTMIGRPWGQLKPPINFCEFSKRRLIS